MLNFMFFMFMYPILFILYFFLKMQGEEKDGLFFGLHAPKEEETKKEFQTLVQEQSVLYRKRMKYSLILLALIPFAVFFIPYFSIDFTIWMLWMLASIVCLELPFALANKTLHHWKKEHKIQQEARQQYIEIKEAGNIRKVHLLSFLPCIFISFIIAILFTIHFKNTRIGTMSILVDIFALTTPLFYLTALWMDHQRVMVISMDSEINLNFSRAKKNYWKNFWLGCSIINTLTTFFIALCFSVIGLSLGIILVLAGLELAFTFLLGFWIFQKLKKLKSDYEIKRELISFEEDDEYWIYGMFYYNKNDRHTMVEARYGMGTTMNLATPIGMGINLVGLATLLVIPISCIWMILLEFTPIELEINDHVLKAKQLSTDYQIPTKQMESIELISELPNLSKVKGTGLDNLYKGNFFAASIGECEVFLNPQNKVFLSFTVGDTLYYMSAKKDEDTIKLYEQLKKLN